MPADAPMREDLSIDWTAAVEYTLTEVSHVGVIPFNPDFEYPLELDQSASLARSLGATHVLATTLDNSTPPSLSFQLLQVSNNQSVWTLDLPVEGFASLWSTPVVTHGIRTALSLSEQVEQSSAPSASDAHAMLLTSNALSRTQRPSSLKRALLLARQAAERDPSSSYAQAKIALLHIRMALAGIEAPDQAFAAAEQALERAKTLGTLPSDAMASIALLQQYSQGSWSNASQTFQQAFALHTNSPVLHRIYANAHLVCAEKFSEATKHAELALRLDLLSPDSYNTLANTLLLSGDTDQALLRVREGILRHPQKASLHHTLGNIHLALEHPEEAIVALQTAASLASDSTDILSSLGYAFAKNNQTGPAQEILEQLKAPEREEPADPIHIARLLTGLGEQELALTYLDKAVAQHATDASCLLAIPEFKVLRSHPRFLKFIENIPLPN